jgi:acyl-[acyl-carrier-protein] desaturase
VCAQRLARIRELEPEVDALIETLRPVDQCWQPSDLLPDPSSEGFVEEVEALRAEAAELSDEMLVVLVGNVVTEEGLPLYLLALNRFGDSTTDPSGTDPLPWARWARAWTAEEKRHGDVTRTYMYLSGRVDLGSVERTVQHFLRNGFDTTAGADPYRGLAYASYQEHATKRSWQQLGSLVRSAGAERLHRICGLVAADEARHERVYASLMAEVVRRDPEGGLDALHATLAHGVVMPARTMTDGVDRRLFQHFADVGHRAGVYTLEDYAANLEQLVAALGLASLTGLSGEAERARDDLCALPARYAQAAEERRAHPPRPVPFRWIYDRRA